MKDGAEIPEDFEFVPRRPPEASAYPDDLSGNPATYRWSRQFRSVEAAEAGVPPGTHLPVPALAPAGYALHQIIANVNPETDEVLFVQVWFGFIGFDNPDRIPVGSEPDLVLSYSRLVGFPVTYMWMPEPESYRESPGWPADRLPLERIQVAGRPGVYDDFAFDNVGQQITRKILDAVRWTAPDATFWTVRGVLPRDELIALAEEVYRPVVFEAWVQAE